MPILRRQPGVPPAPLESPAIIETPHSTQTHSTQTHSTHTRVLNPPTGSMRFTTATAQSPAPLWTDSQATMAQLRQRLHGKIVLELRDSVDLTDDIVVRREVERLFNLYLSEEDLILNRTERAKLQNQVTAEILGYGPIQELINNDEVTEILVNGPSDVWIEQKG